MPIAVKTIHTCKEILENLYYVMIIVYRFVVTSSISLASGSTLANSNLSRLNTSLSFAAVIYCIINVVYGKGKPHD